MGRTIPTVPSWVQRHAGGAGGARTPDLLSAIPIPMESLKGWLVVFSCIYYEIRHGRGY